MKPSLGQSSRLLAFISTSLALSAICATAPLAAQQPVFVGSEMEQYLRLLELDGQVTGTPLVYRSSFLVPRVGGLTAAATHPWSLQDSLRPATQAHRGIVVTPLGADGRMVYNSAIPRSMNDGVLWAGKGASTVVSGGAQMTWGPVTARLYPSFTYSQNRTFPLAPTPFAGNPVNDRSPYSYPWEQLQIREIDWPQRFGDAPVHSFDWGQSGIRLDHGAFTAGYSTENIWWGPGFRNSILMGNSAPGFSHIDMGTGRPAHTPIGDVEVRMIWGSLTRSAFFGSPFTDGHRFLNGLTLGYRPKFLPGLTLGIERVMYQEWPVGGLGFSDVFGVFSKVFNPGTTLLSNGLIGNDLWDQLASVSARWVLPESGFEVYVEYARNDFSGNLRDFLMEPDHARGYTVGFQKALSARNGVWRLAGEFTTVSLPASITYRTSPSFYMTGFAIEGYTNHGQLLGAGIGPGSNSQFLGLDRYTTRGRWGVFIERVRNDDDAFYYAKTFGFPTPSCAYLCHQVDLSLGANAFRFEGPFEVGGSLELTRELSRYFQEDNDLTNLKLSMMLKWGNH